MGILNITPDSFYEGSRYNSDTEILRAAVTMMEDEADILDVGGYSSRPGAPDITQKDEEKRVLKAIKLISRELPGAIISVDTFRAAVAREAVSGCGAHIINDISGGEADSEMFRVVENLNVPYIMMHMKGDPRTMQNNPVYDDVVADILKWFSGRIFRLQSSGVKDIILDPGFGFGKTTEHNFELLQRLGDFSVAGLPLLVGVSRKSMIWKTLGISAAEALNGTTALNAVALNNGADILRVHDVKEAVQTVKLINILKKTESTMNAEN
ncbi:MAG: dihydropteroate synthase [Bacteroidetes bacterium]|nr:MAG: dihydropteroate synthase [Bacteroidota bacterium]